MISTYSPPPSLSVFLCRRRSALASPCGSSSPLVCRAPQQGGTLFGAAVAVDCHSTVGHVEPDGIARTARVGFPDSEWAASIAKPGTSMRTFFSSACSVVAYCLKVKSSRLTGMMYSCTCSPAEAKALTAPQRGGEATTGPTQSRPACLARTRPRGP